jgi:5-methylcytosine-specific restriction endonuclease McrA
MKMILKDKQFHRLMDYLREKTGFKVNNRQSSRAITWEKKVKKVGKCEVCGAREDLHAHHIVPWEYSIKGRTDLSNGQCLCEGCHKMMHNDFLWVEYMRKKVSKNE